MNRDEKMKTIAFKENMDKEEVINLKHEISQLQEIAESFHRLDIGSPNHFIRNRQALMNRTITPTPCTTPGNCVMLGKFCPYPDKTASATENGIFSSIFFIL